MLFKANFAKWKFNSIILSDKREAVNSNEENNRNVCRFINKLPFKQNFRTEGIIFHLNGTETQYIVIAEEFLFPELWDSIFLRDTV